ncbi:MAG: hypothetical protein COT74_13965 [Bdellovibrionales bacterium CG10_big_fil_rev_8_21_14_0_10_45_34]|nr:MAG: hypothetical protein COT74_13965 [Bdellovibrionales bacterium CG10_big_fil_rev_8_21_14_0_10_45_34]
MKFVFVFFAFFTSAIANVGNANASSFDGCYQLLDTGVMYPAVCISGTEEEGISGAGARLAVFNTNTTELAACLISTALKISDKEFIFEIDGQKELVLNNFNTDYGVLKGDATVGRTKIKFVKLSTESTQRLMESAEKGNCI